MPDDVARAAGDALRLHQANERTMLAWVRTGIALMAFGFAIARFGLFLRQIAHLGGVATAPLGGLGSAWVGVVAERLLHLPMDDDYIAPSMMARIHA